MNTVTTEKAVGSKAIVMGCACVIFSCLTPDEIRRFKNLHPESLEMQDEDSNKVFSIDIDDGPGHIDIDGATFSNVTSADGKATITVLLDPDADDHVTMVKEKLVGPLARLMEQENQLMELLPKLSEEEDAVNSQISWL